MDTSKFRKAIYCNGSINWIQFIPVLFLFLLLFGSCESADSNSPAIKNGLLDLRTWNPDQHESIKAQGDWEFRYGEFLAGSRFHTIEDKQYVEVPGVWKKTNGKATGYASYNLIVLLPETLSALAFRIHDLGTAYSFFVNDSLVAKAGNVGRNKEESVPQLLPQTVVIDNLTDTTRITVWISNFDYRKGGFWKALVIGEVDTIIREDTSRMNILLFNAGVWFMVSFMLCCFYVYNPKQKTILYLFLWAFSLLIRQITADDRLLGVLFPALPFELLIKLELISGYAIAPFAIMALSYLYPEEFPRKLSVALLFAVLVFAIIVAALKAIIFSYLVVPYQFLTMVALVFTCIRVFVAIIRKREGAKIIGIAFLLVFFMYLIQILHYNNLINFDFGSTSYTVGFIFAFAQVILLAKLFSSALRKVENFAVELEKTVDERTRELVSTQAQLITVAKQTENEKIRRRISQDIHDDISSGLNKISWMSELVKIKAQRSDTDEINPILDKIITSARESVDNLIEIIWSLNPNNDNLEGLLIYMRNYLNKYFDDTSFNLIVKFPAVPDKIELNPELKRNIFLIMKEAIHNASKYSRAENISLEFTNSREGFQLSISDDGCGFEEGTVKGTGNGMKNMKARADAIKGALIVESGVGKGTKVVLTGQLY